MQIIGFIKQNIHITTKELADEIGISQRKIKENIAKLKEKGILQRLGSSKTGHWEIIQNKNMKDEVKKNLEP